MHLSVMKGDNASSRITNSIKFSYDISFIVLGDKKVNTPVVRKYLH